MAAHITIVGNLGTDPALRYTPHGQPVTNFNIAVNRRRKDQKDETDWYRVTLWGRAAETANEILSKGRKVYVEGEPQQKFFEDHNTGQQRMSMEINANRWEAVDQNPNAQQNQGRRQQGQRSQGQQGQRQAPPQQQQPQQPSSRYAPTSDAVNAF